MLSLHSGEKEILVLRKHWFVIVRHAAAALLLVIALPFILSAISYAARSSGIPGIDALADFLAMLYLMGVVIFLFFVWADYYLDMWIITSDRLLDVEQLGLFSRDVSEIPLERVQDITIEIRGFFETMLHFGTIRIQTAGEREFIIKDVPHLEKTKEIILRYSRTAGKPMNIT